MASTCSITDSEHGRVSACELLEDVLVHAIGCVDDGTWTVKGVVLGRVIDDAQGMVDMAI
jgi:GTPase